MSRTEARRVAYYPGCMSLDCVRELNISMRAVLTALDIEPVEWKGWNCCGGDLGDSVFPEGASALTERILTSAASVGTELVCACPVCASRLGGAKGAVKVSSALELLTRPHTMALLEQRRKETLEGLKAACYYGPSRGGSEEDTPGSPPLEQLARMCGVSPVKWAGRQRPHGGYSAFMSPGLMRGLAGKILTDAMEAGADFILVEDPHAQLNLDLFQYPIGRELKRAVDIPVLFASELAAHALGLDEAEGCYGRHATPPFRMLLDHYDRRYAVKSEPKP